MNLVTLYGLVDPRNDQVRYIGKSVDPPRRLNQHLREARKSESQDYKSRWIRTLLAINLLPVLTVLEVVTSDEWQARERELIAEYRRRFDLTNITAGGEGVDVPRTREWIQKIADSKRGQPYPAESKLQVRQTLIARNDSGCKRGHPWSKENTIHVVKHGKPYRLCRTCKNQSQRRTYKTKGQGRIKTFCKRGHLLAGSNLRLLPRPNRKTSQERICRECVRDRNRDCKRRARHAS